MHVSVKGKPSFCHLEVTLDSGDCIVTESDAMASMDSDIHHDVKLHGGLWGGLMRKLFGGETLFINYFTNKSAEPKKMVLTQPTPGMINHRQLESGSDGFYLQPGAFLARTRGVKISLHWAGFKSWFAREGLFRLYAHGNGYVWYACYGAIYAYELDGEYIVDTSHLVSYPKGVSLHIQLAGKGLFSSFFSGEGFVTRLKGKGTVYLQSRSMSGLASTINQRL